MENVSSSRSKININPANWQIKDLARFNPKNWGTKEFLIFLFAMLLVGLAIPLSLSQVSREKSEQPSPTTAPQKQVFLSPHTLVYGFWTENNSIIKAYDLSTGIEYILAELPKNIKKVTIISPTELLYINNTNERDHGTEIVIYNIQTKATRTVYTASRGFGIDKYVISPNKRYLVLLEVQFASGRRQLKDSVSRIYSLDILNPSIKYLIGEEDSSKTTFIYRPVAITDGGKIYLDKFLPNCGNVCWAYGMRVSTFSGDKKEDLENMPNGSYSPVPYLSSDNKYISFPAYDGSLGPGTELVDGERRATVNPNAIDLLETSTDERRRLPNIPNNRIYLEAVWDRRTSDNLIIAATTLDRKTLEMYWYNLDDAKLTKVTSEPSDSTVEILLASFASDTFLLGSQNITPTNMGNLSCTYSYRYEKISTLNTITNSKNTIPISEPMIQIIGLVPAPFFQDLVQAGALPRKNLQLETFSFKPTLAPQRYEQQTYEPIAIELPDPCAADPAACAPPDSCDDGCCGGCCSSVD